MKNIFFWLLQCLVIRYKKSPGYPVSGPTLFLTQYTIISLFRLGSKGANPNSKMFQVTMEKAQKGKGGRTRGSPAPATGEIKPAKATKRKSSEVMAGESLEGSGLGIGMVWSCQESRYVYFLT